MSRQGLQAGSWETADLASCAIRSGPSAHMTARSMDRAESTAVSPGETTLSVNLDVVFELGR